MTQEITRRADRICEVLYDKKGQEILRIFIGDKSIVADYFVVASGRNSQQVKALADEVEEKLAEEQIFPRRKEGYAEGRWIVLDYSDILVHIFHPEERGYYNLERLWAEGENTVDYSEQQRLKAESEKNN